jgi:hypothetical protein
MKKFIKDILIYGLLIAGMGFIFIKIQPFLTQKLPNDLSRHHVIIDALKNTAVQPQVIVLGDSKGMFGVNAEAISNELPGHPLAYNLSSTGQSLLESSYFISKISDNTKHVLQFADFGTFKNGYDSIALNNYVPLSMIMNGYVIDSVTKKLIKHTDPMFDKNINWVAFEARNNLKSVLHIYSRKLLDDEKFNDYKFNDLYFPNIYVTERHPKYPFYKVRCFTGKDTLYENLLAERVNDYLKSRHIQYHIVLPPVNPDLCTVSDSLDNFLLTQLRQKMPGIDFIDLTNALKKEEFYDGAHPNKRGANKISAMLGQILKGDSLYKK